MVITLQVLACILANPCPKAKQSDLDLVDLVPDIKRRIAFPSESDIFNGCITKGNAGKGNRVTRKNQEESHTRVVVKVSLSSQKTQGATNFKTGWPMEDLIATLPNNNRRKNLSSNYLADEQSQKEYVDQGEAARLENKIPMHGILDGNLNSMSPHQIEPALSLRQTNGGLVYDSISSSGCQLEIVQPLPDQAQRLGGRKRPRPSNLSRGTLPLQSHKMWGGTDMACICGVSGSFRGSLTWVACASCHGHMHGQCAGFVSEADLQSKTRVEEGSDLALRVICSKERCPCCAIHDEGKGLIRSGATLIVTPPCKFSCGLEKSRQYLSPCSFVSCSQLLLPLIMAFATNHQLLFASGSVRLFATQQLPIRLDFHAP